MDKRLDELFAKFEELNKNIETRFDSLEKKYEQNISTLVKRISTCEGTTKDLEKHAEHVDIILQENKKIIENLLKKDSLRDAEFKSMAAEMDQMRTDLSNQQITNNQSAQYPRSSLNVIIGNVPLQEGVRPEKEDSRNIVNIIAKGAKFTDFNRNDIDVAHRLPCRKGIPSIIVRFKFKAARMQFYAQRKKLMGHTPASLGLVESDDEVTVRGATARRDEEEGKNIYITESLTSMNGELLRQAKEIAKAKHYKFFGYTVNGEVRVKKTEGSDYIPIKCKAHLENII